LRLYFFLNLKSEEDRQLKEELNLCVEKLQENDQKIYRNALDILRKRIKESTSSMTSVPKPLKFLREHYDTLKAIYEKIFDKETKV
jgi:26S proteasome regulatory subunit N1